MCGSPGLKRPPAWSPSSSVIRASGKPWLCRSRSSSKRSDKTGTKNVAVEDEAGGGGPWIAGFRRYAPGRIQGIIRPTRTPSLAARYTRKRTPVKQTRQLLGGRSSSRAKAKEAAKKKRKTEAEHGGARTDRRDGDLTGNGDDQDGRCVVTGSVASAVI